MFVTVMQWLEEDGRNGSIFVLYSPLNAKFMSEVSTLTVVHTNDAPSCGRSLCGQPFITTSQIQYFNRT